jgi:predicted ATPase
MPRRFTDLAFTPDINELMPPNVAGAVAVLTGANNSGKSAYLKKIVTDPTCLYIGVNRFYSVHHLPRYQENAHERNQWFQSMNTNRNQEHQNFENSYYNAATGITGLTDTKRAVLMSTFYELFGLKIEVRSEDPNNEFSNRYIDVDGDSLSVTSSGTRLFLSLLAALMDSRFSTVAIDEPELGLSPTLQRKLSEILVRGQRKSTLFPHNPNIIISTHSHLFLDKETPTNNWLVTKSGNLISARRCSGFSELHDIQFRLLGNDLGELFLPDFAMFVEGETDRLYLEKVLAISLPKAKIAVQSCGGDLAARLTYWAASLGDMQLSPYRNRTLIVYDKVKQAGIVRASDNAGLPPQSRIEWSENGIEFLYPLALLQAIYRHPVLSYADLHFDKDRVSVGDLSYTKMELCKMVVAQITVQTAFPQEIEQKLLGPMRQIMG